MSMMRIASPKIYPKGVSLPHLKIYLKGVRIVSHRITMGGKDEANNEREAIGSRRNSAEV